MRHRKKGGTSPDAKDASAKMQYYAWCGMNIGRPVAPCILASWCVDDMMTACELLLTYQPIFMRRWWRSPETRTGR